MTRYLLGMLALCIATTSNGHNTGGLGCDGEKEQPKVRRPAYFTDSEQKQIRELEGQIAKAQNIFVYERFAQTAPATEPAYGPQYPVAWEDAKRLVLMGFVVSVSQTHALEVTLTTKSGRTYKTKEPSIDDIFAAVDIVDPCGLFIVVSTE